MKSGVNFAPIHLLGSASAADGSGIAVAKKLFQLSKKTSFLFASQFHPPGIYKSVLIPFYICLTPLAF